MIVNHFSKFNKTYIIAEIGVNHNGNIDLAKKMIIAAKKAGADAVKFQTFKAKYLASINTPKVEYQLNTSDPNESHYEMLKKLELSYEDHISLKEFSESLSLDFLSTPYDIESAQFLQSIKIKYFKIASADLIDLPMHEWISRTGIPTILSVGMASPEEIKNTINIYKKANHSDLVLLHCVSNYPCSDLSLNMLVMNYLKNTFKLPIGFSDHSLDNIASIISIGLGACIVEKHFTLDKNLQGPDHLASSTPMEFLQLVNSIRRAEKMMGSEIKICQPEEMQMSKISRKSIVLKKSLNSGHVLTLDDLVLKRPGTGLPPKEINKIIGKKIKRDLQTEHLLSYDDLLS
jgi:N,N'-diacetyllegionaminate synthase